ncbi:hypothetical protein ACHAXR_005635 [Thalassiosira sp. AJA248-18]
MVRTITLLLFAWFSVGPPTLLVWAFSSFPPPSTHLEPSRRCYPLHPSSHHKFHWAILNSAAGNDRGENSEGHTDGGDLPPLFAEQNDSSIQPTIKAIDEVSPSLLQSIEGVRKRHLSNDNIDSISNDDLLKRIVQAGIQFQQKQTQRNATIENASDPLAQILSFPNMEKVPGCIATVHLKTTLIPILDDTTAKYPSDYRLTIEGTADAMLSGGLLAILADAFSGGEELTHNTQENTVTAADILKLDPGVLTAAMGLQSVLSRGRNDGMASMVRVVQCQIKSLVGEAYETHDMVDAEKLNQLLKPASSIVENQKDTTHKPTVAMLLSGGVDSSVALHLLLRQNYNVTAFYLRIWLEDELSHLGECPWEDDLQVCQAVCEHAGNVPLETVSLGKEYREQVVQYTIEEAQRGRTPNPDIMCNSRVKFGCFLEYIEKSGMDFDYVASGHYARLEDEVVPGTDTIQNPKKRLFRAPDPVKDQSYFLCALTQKQLSKVLFPIGNYQKSEVRELATHFQLPNRNRPDSQGLCFLGKVKFDEFLASYLGKRPGDVVDALTGEVIGRHNGLWYHTVGQRKGIGKVMTPLATARGPWYVVAKDQSQDIVFVSNRYEEEDFARARSEFEVEDVRWILGKPPVEALSDEGSQESWKEVQMDLKIRHGPRIVQGKLLLKGDGSTGNISLDKKDGGLAPGQYVVFYQMGTEECQGAGVISEKHWAKFLQNYADKTEEGAVRAA